MLNMKATSLSDCKQMVDLVKQTGLKRPGLPPMWYATNGVGPPGGKPGGGPSNNSPRGGRRVDRVETAIWVLSPAGGWNRFGDLPVPLLGPAARIMDARLVVAGGASRGFDPLPNVWAQDPRRKRTSYGKPMFPQAILLRSSGTITSFLPPANPPTKRNSLR
jgi:hypothetical protein